MTSPRVPWEGSDRAKRLPPNWARLRLVVRDRAGGQCEYRESDGWRCPELGTDCDHIVPGDDHSLDNLQWMCRFHHLRKTQGDNTRRKIRKNRPPEQHPGLRS